MAFTAEDRHHQILLLFHISSEDQSADSCITCLLDQQLPAAIGSDFGSQGLVFPDAVRRGHDLSTSDS